MTATFYRVSASIRDKAHKEVRNVRTLWQGPAGDAKQAIVSAHAALGPLVKGEPRADTIVLHIHDPKGGLTTTTEYAEDFLVGKGASLGSALLDEHADHGLSAEETTAAKRALEQKAVEAVLAPADPFEGYVDAADLVIGEVDGGEVEGAIVYTEPCGYDLKDYEHKTDPASVDEGIFKQEIAGSWVNHDRDFGRTIDIRHADALSDPIGVIGNDTRKNKGYIDKIRVSREVFNSLLDKALGSKNKPGMTIDKLFGVPIEVDRELHPDQIQYIHKPRNQDGSIARGFQSGGFVGRKPAIFLDEAAAIPKHLFDKIARDISASHANQLLRGMRGDPNVTVLHGELQLTKDFQKRLLEGNLTPQEQSRTMSDSKGNLTYYPEFA